MTTNSTRKASCALNLSVVFSQGPSPCVELIFRSSVVLTRTGQDLYMSTDPTNLVVYAHPCDTLSSNPVEPFCTSSYTGTDPDGEGESRRTGIVSTY